MSPLQGEAFETLFAADLPVRQIPFRVGDRDAFVELRPMDHAALQRFLIRTAGVVGPDGSLREGLPADAMLEWEQALVAATVVGWSLPRRRPDGTWETLVASELADQRAAQVRGWALTPVFWQMLVAECLETNALTGLAQGN